MGHGVGALARRLYDPEGKGSLIEWEQGSFKRIFATTRELMRHQKPVFEAAFSTDTAMAIADIMLPDRHNGKEGWRMVEVKAAPAVKPQHHDDAAIQAFVARAAGVPLTRIALACINADWTYPGNEDYRGFLIETDLTPDAFSRVAEVRQWIASAHDIAAQDEAPARTIGAHCHRPYPCSFLKHCLQDSAAQGEPANLHWLASDLDPGLQSRIDAEGITSLKALPDTLLSPTQQRTKAAILSDNAFIDLRSSVAILGAYRPPCYFLDMKAARFAIPLWAGCRPFQEFPFQFCLQHLAKDGRIEQHLFQDLSGTDPARAFAEALISACGGEGAIVVYQADTVTACLRALAARFGDLQRPLLGLHQRITGLFPVVRDHTWHPDQQGDWSLPTVLRLHCPRAAPLPAEDTDASTITERYRQAGSRAERERIGKALRENSVAAALGLLHLWALLSGQTLET